MGENLLKESLRQLLGVSFVIFPSVTEDIIFTVGFWNSVRDKIYDLGSKRDFGAFCLLPIFQVAYKVVKLEAKPNPPDNSIHSLPLVPRYETVPNSSINLLT